MLPSVNCLFQRNSNFQFCLLGAGLARHARPLPSGSAVCNHCFSLNLCHDDHHHLQHHRHQHHRHQQQWILKCAHSPRTHKMVGFYQTATVGRWKADPYCKLQWRDWIKAIFATQDWLQSYPVNNSLGDIEARGQGSSCQHNQHWSISREQSLPLRLLRSKHTWFGEGCAKKEYQMRNIGLEGSYIFSLISSVILMEKMRFLKRLHGFKLFHFAHF